MSRRRAYSGSDSSDEEQGRARQKRRKTSESGDLEDRLESLISRVGEKSTSSLESNLEGLATVLEADLPNYKSKILKLLCTCAVEKPEKLTIYTTLIGLINAKNYSAGGEFVELAVRELKEALRNNEYECAHVLLRFLADLVNCHVVLIGSVMSMFDNFVEVTLEDNIPQVRSDWYVYAVLSTLPWVARELYEKKPEEFNRALNTIENYLRKRSKAHLPILQVWTTDDFYPQEEYLDCLWAQISSLRDNEWTENQILRPYQAFDAVLCDALQHSIPQVLPPGHTEDSKYPLPYVVFRLFDYTDVPEGPVLPGSHAIERYLYEDMLHATIHANYLERKDCAAAMLSLPLKSEIPLNYMIVEILFAQLFNLPRPPYLEIFYGTLFIELCKLQPGSMPQVLAQATEMLFERLPSMNTTCIERFVNWFSYHLSNFQFRWSWDDWAPCMKGDLLAPQPHFIREVLARCLRLSYHQRVVDFMPKDFAALLPSKPQPRFKYEKDGAATLPGYKTVQQLLQAIRAKCEPTDVIDILRSCPAPDGITLNPTFNPLKIETLIQSLLFLGAKSFSHSFAAIAKFHVVLKALCETEEGQITLLQAVYDLWRNNQQMLVALIDKLLKTQVIECASVANWVFSSDLKDDFPRFYLWEMMHSTVNKMNKHVLKLQRELEDGKDKIEAAKKKAAEGFDFFDDEKPPSDELIERMEDRLQGAQSEQKSLFLIIFQRFILLLSEHITACEQEGVSYNNPWYKWAVERLQEFFLLHNEQVRNYTSTLENLVFTSEVDSHVLKVFQQFCALYT